MRSSPNIFFCGDPHGRLEHIVQAVAMYRPDAIILLGDITPERPLHVELASILDLTEVWWIHGNHDTDNEACYDNLFGSKLADRNLHGRIAEIAGLRVAGLGGVFRGKVWKDNGTMEDSPAAYLATCGKGNRWRAGLPLRHRSSIFPSEVIALSRHRADVLVTHEAPDLHEHGFAALTKLAVDMGVSKAFHGHHHQDRAYAGNVWHGVADRAIQTLDGLTVKI